ncbi:MAG: SIS domain-containing protein [Erysipelotrichaceae bacterium]|nr:SIS domain-containing protein [Erysipelotrichaceae bacterium]
MVEELKKQYDESIDLILSECKEILSKVDPKETEELIELLCSSRRVFFVGVGRVLLSLEAMAKRLAHLGIETHVVGDINEPAMNEEDLLIVGSGSGESIIPVAIAKKAKEIGGKIVHIGSNPDSTIAKLADLQVRIPAATKLHLPDEYISKQPLTSLFEQCLMIYGDALAALIIRKKGIDVKSLWDTHANLE